jgi:type III secretory pathway component EscU
MKAKIKLILGMCLIWQTGFLLINFIYLLVNGGEAIIHEHNTAVLTFEVIANIAMFVFAGLCSYGFWREYIKEIRMSKPTSQIQGGEIEK